VLLTSSQALISSDPSVLPHTIPLQEMKMFIGSKGTVGTLKSNSYHFEETNPEEDAVSVEVRLTSRASSDNDEEELGAPGMEEEGANTAADNNNNCAAGSVPTTLTGRQDEGADE
jgi:hypothetical protein